MSWLPEELVGKGHEVTLSASSDSRTTARLVPGCPARSGKTKPVAPGCLNNLGVAGATVELLLVRHEDNAGVNVLRGQG